MWTLLYPHGRPTSTQAPQTCSQIASLFSTSTWNLPLVLESRLNLLKELTSLGAISLPTAQPHSHHTPSFRFSSHSGLYSAPSPQDLCTYCSLCLGHLLSLLALVNSCSSFYIFPNPIILVRVASFSFEFFLFWEQAQYSPATGPWCCFCFCF